MALAETIEAPESRLSNKPKCVECGADTQVTETRPGDGAAIMQRRTRKCKCCGALFNTIEIYAPDQSIPRKDRRPSARA